MNNKFRIRSRLSGLLVGRFDLLTYTFRVGENGVLVSLEHLSLLLWSLVANQQVDFQNSCKTLFWATVNDCIGKSLLDGLTHLTCWDCPATTSAVGDFDQYVFLGRTAPHDYNIGKRSQFYHQTAIMFRKKHTEINIKLPFRPYSPFSNKNHSPSPFTQPNRNLSPMKNHNRTPTARQGRPQFLPNTASKSPRNIQNTFEAQLSSLASEVGPKYPESRPFPSSKFGYQGDCTTEGASFCNLSTFSKDVPMKESKKLFTKCISEMNSAKRRDGSSVLCLAETSRQAVGEGYSSSRKGGNATSFKALKIQMIESVLPDEKCISEKKHYEIDSKRLESASNMKGQIIIGEGCHEIKGFSIEEDEKKENVIQLINQSFSNVGISQLTQKAKLMESVYESEHSDYTDFDLLLQKVQLGPMQKRTEEEHQSVRASVESIKSQFDFDLVP